MSAQDSNGQDIDAQDTGVQDIDDEHAAPGAVPAARTVKAGCGIRFDPESLSEAVGFDFSDASSLLEAYTDTDTDADAGVEESSAP